MKRHYTKPEANTVEIATCQMLAASPVQPSYCENEAPADDNDEMW